MDLIYYTIIYNIKVVLLPSSITRKEQRLDHSSLQLHGLRSVASEVDELNEAD